MGKVNARVKTISESELSADDFKLILQKLAEQIATSQRIKYEIWEAEECCEYLKVSPSAFTQFVKKHASFPRAIRLPLARQTGSGKESKARPKWFAKDVIEYVKKHIEE